MSSLTRDQLQARLDAYVATELKILQSQEYQVGDRSTGRRNRRAELEQVQAGIRETRAEIDRLDAVTTGARRVLYIR